MHTTATRREFLQGASAVGAGLWAFGPAAAAAAGPARPDVLFIAIEDVSPHRFGCYGNTVCRTPHLDRFAAGGLRFAQAYTNPPCCPSRTALLLAKRPETTRVFGNNHDWHKTCPDALTMPRHFRDQGYEVLRCGKMFHGSFEDDASWSRVINPNEGLPPPARGRKPPRGPGADIQARLRAEGKDPKQLPGGSPFSYGPSGRDDLDEVDGRVAEQGIRILRGRPDDAPPMLLCLGFHATHLPFHAPDKYFEPYPPENMELPQNPGAGPDGMPGPGVFREYNPHTPEQWREAIAAHYACVTFVDAQIGRVLQAIEESGRADRTIVVIWSDHGFQLGEQFLWRKGPLRDHSNQVALLWRAPGVTTPGSVCPSPVESIDIFPTLMQLCGVPLPDDIEAASMVPLLRNPAAPWKKGALMTGAGGRSIVTGRWRYNEYPEKGREAAELFDRQTDPGEFVNLADGPEHADTVARLAALLEGGWRACRPE
ncbi:MAG: sulfatase [Lentisphaeria bacterium]|nr:sulfatase [Lentisphaeria bacterium]